MATSSFKAFNLRLAIDESEFGEASGEVLVAHLPQQGSIEVFLARCSQCSQGPKQSSVCRRAMPRLLLSHLENLQMPQSSNQPDAATQHAAMRTLLFCANAASAAERRVRLCSISDTAWSFYICRNEPQHAVRIRCRLIQDRSQFLLAAFNGRNCPNRS